jgi:hypothetical protein
MCSSKVRVMDASDAHSNDKFAFTSMPTHGFHGAILMQRTNGSDRILWQEL